MEDGMVCIVLTEDRDKAFIKAVNQRITNAPRELVFISKWAHCVHHTLVIGKHRGANNVAIAINI